MIVVSDTSPLIYLAALGELNLLPRLYGRVLIPPAVHTELQQGLPREPALDAIGDWMEVVVPRDAAQVATMRRVIDQGEAEALVLAQECGADLLLVDDGRGRAMAHRCGVRAQGVLGVLLDAKRNGAVTDLRPLLERLVRETNFRIKDEIFRQALALAGEND